MNEIHAARTLHATLDMFHDPCVVTTSLGRPARLDPSLPFEVWRWIPVDRLRGAQFTEATGDSNPVHSEGGVVPGAFMVAQCLLTLEVLMPDVRLEQLCFSFTRPSYYGLDLELVLRGQPADDGSLQLDCDLLQAGRPVANASLTARPGEAPSREEAVLDPQVLARLSDVAESLGVDAELYLTQARGCYPLSFLCALPSGRLVDQLGGAGGLLSRLTLAAGTVGLPLDEAPQVALRLPRRPRARFNRIEVKVWSRAGVALSGTALVLQPESACEALARPSNRLRRGA